MADTALVLDAGALIGYERADRGAVGPIARARDLGQQILVPSGVLAQAWRSGSRQARLAALLRQTQVIPLDAGSARGVGILLGRSGASDVVDASVVLCAMRRDGVVLTSDPADLRRIHPRVHVETI